MSKRSIVLSIITGLAVSSTAVALTLPNGEEVEELTGNARWGCEVLLCLSNPNGPRAVAECRPPIDKLFKCLSKRHPCKFPKCPQAGAGNEAKQLSDHYDPCFLYGEGYEEAPKGYLGETYVQAKASNANLSKYAKRRAESRSYSNVQYNHNGTYKFYFEDYGWETAGSKACVRGKPKKYRERTPCSSDESGDCYRTVYVYDDIIWQEMQSSRAIDVYIDGKIFKRVHW